MFKRFFKLYKTTKSRWQRITDIKLPMLIKIWGIRNGSIVHVGAGEATEAFSYHSLGFTEVVWFEALPQLVEVVKNNLKDFPYQSVIHAALWDSQKTLTLNVASNLGSSSLLPSSLHSSYFPEVHFRNSIQIETSTLDSHHLSLSKPIFLILDVQGAEIQVLAGAKKLLEDVEYIYTEFSSTELYKGGSRLETLTDLLKPAFELVDWQKSKVYGYGNALFIRSGLAKWRRLRRLKRVTWTLSMIARNSLAKVS